MEQVGESKKGTLCFARQVLRFSELRREVDATDGCSLLAGQRVLSAEGGSILGAIQAQVGHHALEPKVVAR